MSDLHKVVRYKNKFHTDSQDTFKNIRCSTSKTRLVSTSTTQLIMVNALVSVDGVELVGELQLTTLEYLELRGGALSFIQQDNRQIMTL